MERGGGAEAEGREAEDIRDAEGEYRGRRRDVRTDRRGEPDVCGEGAGRRIQLELRDGVHDGRGAREVRVLLRNKP